MKEVIIEVFGGVAEVISKPEEVRVIIRDYDIKVVDIKEIKVDENGDPCTILIYN